MKFKWTMPLSIAFVLLALSVGCREAPPAAPPPPPPTAPAPTTTTTVNVRPHDAENAVDTRYCKFTIINVLGGEDARLGVGDTLCVVCGFDQCPGERIIIPAPGIEYFVEIEGLTSCVSCQGVDLDNFYEDLP